jgi:hypothetical protein
MVLPAEERPARDLFQVVESVGAENPRSFAYSSDKKMMAQLIGREKLPRASDLVSPA